MTSEAERHKTPASQVVTIFLDFDGVLHPVGAKADRLFERAGMLNRALQNLPPTEVVISSSWAAYHPLQELRDLLEGWPALHARIVGSTQQRGRGPNLQSDFPERETQCLDWLITHQRSLYRWVAIDDDRLNFATLDRVVLTDSVQGLTREDLIALRVVVEATGKGWF